MRRRFLSRIAETAADAASLAAHVANCLAPDLRPGGRIESALACARDAAAHAVALSI